MKTLYKNIQILIIFLSIIFLLQSCHVYHKTPISLDQAVTANKRMKVITTDDKKYKFRKIEKTDSIYYGVAVVKNQLVKVPIQRAKIQSIHGTDKEGSTLITIGAFVVPIIISFFAIAYSF